MYRLGLLRRGAELGALAGLAGLWAVGAGTARRWRRAMACALVAFLASAGVASADGTFAFSGFFAPVGNQPAVNVVNAGSAVPIRFSLGGNQGLNIFNGGSPSMQFLSNCTIPLFLPFSTATAGNSSLAYDPTTNTYTYTLKTDKDWAGQCGLLSVILVDGSIHTATFQFK